MISRVLVLGCSAAASNRLATDSVILRDTELGVDNIRNYTNDNKG